MNPTACGLRKPFANRTQAGQALADELLGMNLTPPLVVLALPRGGVPVAAEIARALGAPLDLLLVREIGAPFNGGGRRGQRLAAGRDVQRRLRRAARRGQGLDRVTIAAGCAARYRTPPQRVLVGEPTATGARSHGDRVGRRHHHRRHPTRLIVAVPVGTHATIAELGDEVDEVVCLLELRPFHAIGLHYRDFHQLGDDEVCAALQSLRSGLAAPGQSSPAPGQ